MMAQTPDWCIFGTGNIISPESDMADTVKMATARELVDAGAVRHATLLGQKGGYAILLRIGMKDQLLATKEGSPRLFVQLHAAAKLLRDELGVARFDVDATHYAPGDVTRKSPRVSALRRSEQEAIRHDRWFRERVSATLDKADKGYRPLDVVFDSLDQRAHALQGRGASA